MRTRRSDLERPDPSVRHHADPGPLHITEPRHALVEAYAACQRPAPTWTDPTIVRGQTPIKAQHFQEILAAARELQ